MSIQKLFKLTITTIALIIIINSLTPNLVLAADTAAKETIAGRLEKVGTIISTDGAASKSLPAVIGRIIKVVLSLVGAIFMIYIIYAGYLWLTAAGSEEKIKKAKDIIRGSIIGLIIILAAYIITTTVVNRLIDATGYKTSARIPTTINQG